MTRNDDDSGPDLPGLDELITLREAAELSGLSASHLALLVRRGDIWGVKLGHNWLTTAQAVGEYLARDRRPGPKPKRCRHAHSSVTVVQSIVLGGGHVQRKWNWRPGR
jgi:excisionase family DNA binding protein